MPSTIPISISVIPGTHSITYNPSTAHVDNGDFIDFSGSGPFRLNFHAGSPFEDGTLEVPTPTGKTKRMQIKKIGKGTFPYFVAIYDSASNQVFLDAHCPEIIIH